MTVKLTFFAFGLSLQSACIVLISGRS